MQNTLIRPASLSRNVRRESPEMTVSEAREIAGPLSKPSKMPGWGYGLPARECAMGGKLRSVKGSVCEGCYAMKGNYAFKNVQRAQYARLDSVVSNPAWIDAMITLISDAVDPSDPYFRWHDSGDLQSVDHLRAIAEIARRTPWVRYWIPTREFQIVARFRAESEVPPNLVIRLSAHMVEGKTPDGYGFPVSGVYRDWETFAATNPDSLRCPAPNQGNECGSCRTCWNPDARSVSYHKH